MNGRYMYQDDEAALRERIARYASAKRLLDLTLILLSLPITAPIRLLLGGRVGNIRELFETIRHPILQGGRA